MPPRNKKSPSKSPAPESERQVIDYSERFNQINPNSGIPNQDTPINPADVTQFLNPANDPSQQDITANFSVAHYSSDTDNHMYALHHTLGNGPNQAAPGAHKHNNIDSLPIPVSSISEIAAGLQSYTPVWTASGTAPAIGNGSLKGRYLKLGTLWIVFLDWFSGSTTTYGTGTWSFSLPSAPGINSTVPGAPVGMLNNGGFHWPVSGYYTGTTIGPVVANNADIIGANDPATRVWAAGSFLRMTCIYES